MNNSSTSELHYRMSGSGHPVVFLHGFLESSTMWEYLPLDELDVLKIYIDLPGHGQSALPEGTPEIRTYAAAVHALLKELAVETYSVVGHSMGGYVALELMRMEPEPGQVVLLNSNFWTDSEEKKADRIRVADVLLKTKARFLREAIPNLFGDAAKHRQEIDRLIAEAEGVAPEGFAHASLAMRARRDAQDLVSSMKEKVLILQGEADAIVPAETMAQKCGDELVPVQIAGAGHMAHIEQPGKVMEELKSFLTRR